MGLPFLNPPTWEDHFHEHLLKSKKYSLLKPCIYEGQPFWYGGIRNMKNKNFDQFETIMDFQCELYIVPFRDLKKPTIEQYNRRFWQDVENGTYRINGEGEVIKPAFLKVPKVYKRKRKVNV